MRTDLELEELVRRADPAVDVGVVSPGIDAAARIRAAGHRRPSRRLSRIARPVAVAAAAVLVVAVVSLLLVQRSSDDASASVLLRRLSVQAAQAPPLRPGEYQYTASTEPVVRLGGLPYAAYYAGTVQTWIGADGSGRQVVTVDPQVRFVTDADREAWIAAGAPDFGDPSPEWENHQREWTFQAGQDGGPPIPVPVLDVSGLPTDPDLLRPMLEAGQTGIPTIDDLSSGLGDASGNVNACTTPDCETFLRAAKLLATPAFGSSPALRQALLEVMSEVPGVSFEGDSTDDRGRDVSTFSYTSPLSFGDPNGADTCDGEPGSSQGSGDLTYRLAIDRETAEVTHTEITAVGGPVDQVCPGRTPVRSLQGWRDLDASGIVTSPFATP